MRVAAVTGASGFVAGVLIKHLTQRGYVVRGTVRSLQDKTKVEHLTTSFPKLQLFEADLLHEGSFSACFKDAQYVFHTASPFQMQVKDPQKDLIEPAVKGTENVVSEALRSPTVKRIIVTSSVAAVRRSDKPDEYVFSENDWNETSSIGVDPYPLSKTLAEKKAWELFKAHDQKSHPVGMVVINPSFVLGAPVSARTDSTSIRTITALMNGDLEKEGAIPVRYATIAVDDVALAHILAAENENASGRYIVSWPVPRPQLELANILRKHFPKYPLPVITRNPDKMNRDFRLDNSRVQKELGLKLTPIEEILPQMAQTLIDMGVIKKL